MLLSFVLAASGCAFAGMCYSEFATMIPIAGSAYTYAYATMGELLARHDLKVIDGAWIRPRGKGLLRYATLFRPYFASNMAIAARAT